MTSAKLPWEGKASRVGLRRQSVLQPSFDPGRGAEFITKPGDIELVWRWKGLATGSDLDGSAAFL